MKRLVVFVGALALAGAAWGAQSPGQKCETGKNMEAGKYASCLHKAEAKLLKTKGACSVTSATVCYGDEDCPVGETCAKDLTKYGEAVAKCEGKFEAKWDKLTETAVDKGGLCPDGLQQTEVKGVVDDCVANVAGGLAGDGLTDCSGDLAQCTGDLGTCASDLGTCNTDLGTCNGSLTTCTTSLGTAQSGTAVAGDVLSGETFASAAGLSVTGTMPNNGAVNITPSTSAQTIAEGYHDGSGAVAGDSDLSAANIKDGVEIFGVTGTYAPACGNGLIESGEECDQGNLDGGTCVGEGFAGGVLRCGSGCVYDTSECYAARFEDNGDGTITDHETRLMWEKKVKLDSTPDPANQQDADNVYRWSGTCSVATSKRCQPNLAASAACFAGVEGDTTGCDECTGGEGVCSPGITIWQWLNDLNTANYGGHNDWRVPGRQELVTLVDYADATPPVTFAALDGPSCGAACTDVNDPACSCTQSSGYWSASTRQTVPSNAWFVFFVSGGVNASDDKTDGYYVRAVRSGS